MSEDWRPIPGWPYEASNLGRIRRAAPGPNTHVGKVLRFKVNSRGRPYVLLRNSGRKRAANVGRLVLEAFAGLCPPEHECNHKDGDPFNNRPDNLEWVTRSENVRHAFENGLNKPNGLRGEATGHAKLTVATVRLCRDLHSKGHTITELGQRFGVASVTVYREPR